MSTVKEINIEEIKLDGGTQTRAAINKDHVARLAESEDPWDPIIVYFDGEVYWLANGFHRILAAIEKKLETITAEVRTGGQRDALLHAVGANHIHDRNGLPRSKADRYAAITIMLTDPEWSAWSNVAIAKACHCREKEVREMEHLRPETKIANADGARTSDRVVTRGGKRFVMRTGKIGKKRRQSGQEILDGMDPDKAKAAIEEAEQVCTCTCPACRKCKKHPKMGNV